MNSGTVYSINTATQRATVITKGRSIPNERNYQYPKGASISVGDHVAIDNVDGSERIIAVYGG